MFNIIGVTVILGMAITLLITFFMAYPSGSIVIRIGSEGLFEAILLPVCILWGIYALIRMIKSYV